MSFDGHKWYTKTAPAADMTRQMQAEHGGEYEWHVHKSQTPPGLKRYAGARLISRVVVPVDEIWVINVSVTPWQVEKVKMGIGFTG